MIHLILAFMTRQRFVTLRCECLHLLSPRSEQWDTRRLQFSVQALRGPFAAIVPLPTSLFERASCRSVTDDWMSSESCHDRGLRLSPIHPSMRFSTPHCFAPSVAPKMEARGARAVAGVCALLLCSMHVSPESAAP